MTDHAIIGFQGIILFVVGFLMLFLTYNAPSAGITFLSFLSIFTGVFYVGLSEYCED